MSKQYAARLKKELAALLKDPLPNVRAFPDPKNILDWHYCIIGPVGSPYEGGVYHGKVRFTTEYPFKPPSILMMTPSGRFEVNKRICLSMSDFHPETWNPMWSVSSILAGLLSFMLEETKTTGSVDGTPEERRKFAQDSLEYNKRDTLFRELFLEDAVKLRDAELAKKNPGASSSSSSSAKPASPVSDGAASANDSEASAG
eukprot:tig00000241_g20972.t2